MNEARLSVWILAPGGGPGFSVTLSGDGGRFHRAARAGERAEFILPPGEYRLCVRGGPGCDPGAQTKWVRVRGGCECCYTAVFRRPRNPTIRFFVRDANYPNLIPLNGGITYMAATEHTISFTNGVSQPMTLPAGTYTFVSSTIRGYEGEYVTATDFTITEDSQTVTIQLTADGILTVNVIDDVGAPITGGQLALATQDGATEYGNPVSISNQGAAVFNNVPYDANAPVDVWIKQNASDSTHIPMTGTQAEQLDQKSDTAQILNQRKQMGVTLNVVDANYPGLVPLTGTLVFRG